MLNFLYLPNNRLRHEEVIQLHSTLEDIDIVEDLDVSTAVNALLRISTTCRKCGVWDVAIVCTQYALKVCDIVLLFWKGKCD